MKDSSIIIATKVHGWEALSAGYDDPSILCWCKDGEDIINCDDFDPENNDIQAREALEAWCRKEGSRDANLEYDGELWSVLLNEDEEDRHRNWYPKCKADVTNKSLSAAIVEAICSAVGEVE